MTIATTQFRQVWRTLNDGNEDVKVLLLQQWHETEGWEHPEVAKYAGYWMDVSIATASEETDEMHSDHIFKAFQEGI
jgi:hypothetical protein